MTVMTVRMSATHLYCFHVGCSWCSPIAVWSACDVCEVSCAIELLDEVDDGEDHDPDDVDEVPVQSRDIDDERVLGAESATHVDREERQQPQHAHGHVRAVE